LPDGQGAVYLLRDVTAARQLEQAKTEFLANASHELRAPLTPILGYADLLGRHSDLSRNQIDAMAHSIAGSTRRMSRVVDLLVDVAALDAGRVHAAPEAIEVGAFVAGRLADWRIRVPDRAGDLGRRVASGLQPVLADRALLTQAIDELVDNALKYTEPGVSVTVAAARGAVPERILLTVRDTGAGLDPVRQESLLGAFTQADASATRAREGLGLGLAYVARVVAVLGGQLSVNSEPGSGAAFTIDVPAAPARPRPAPRPRRGSPQRSAGTASVSGIGRAKAARRRGGPTA
jgi:signal transduction histidine kinase